MPGLDRRRLTGSGPNPAVFLVFLTCGRPRADDVTSGRNSRLVACPPLFGRVLECPPDVSSTHRRRAISSVKEADKRRAKHSGSCPPLDRRPFCLALSAVSPASSGCSTNWYVPATFSLDTPVERTSELTILHRLAASRTRTRKSRAYAFRVCPFVSVTPQLTPTFPGARAYNLAGKEAEGYLLLVVAYLTVDPL